jgi:xylan 1,4-beta-xylosidase
MTRITRRQTLTSIVTCAAATAAAPVAVSAPNAAEKSSPPCAPDWSSLRWAAGIEGQRKADLGDGTFLNPIRSGDRPDPSIIKVGKDYYLTFSTFDGYPGLVIWHSRDLVSWQPVIASLTKPVGSVWAPELVYHGGKFQIFFHARTPEYRSNYVITAKTIRGPWSDPVDLKLPNHIDPGHIVGEDGKRYLFLSGGDRVQIRADGLATQGAVEHVYDPWRYPEDWVVETFAPEGPKVLRHGGYFYMITAVGGTAGPATGHMVIVARSKSIHGPWENAPNNPIVRTQSATEKWWSRGHATPIEGPDGSWWLIYHGYEHGFWTLGRQTLLDPMEWTADGWIAAKGGDLSAPIRKPRGGEVVPHGAALSDDFSTNRFGVQWSFYDPAPDEMQRVRYENGALIVKGKGTQPNDCSPISFLSGDHAYQVEIEIEIDGDAQAGVLLFYNRRLYCGLGFNEKRFVMHRYGLERNARKPDNIARRAFLRITNDRHIVTLHHSPDGKAWKKFDVQMEVSGYHHNVAGDFLSLRPAIYVSGAGDAKFRNLKYTAL